jgi:hypothetical protein
VFTTGYTRNAIVHHGRLDPGVQMISKPCSFAERAPRCARFSTRRALRRDDFRFAGAVFSATPYGEAGVVVPGTDRRSTE